MEKYVKPLCVLGEALMDCVAQAGGDLRPLRGGSPYNMARAAALAGATVHYLNPLSTDLFGQDLGRQLRADGVHVAGGQSACPTSLAVVQLQDGQPHYGFYREGIADRDWQPEAIIERLRALPPGVLHTGSLMLIPPDDAAVMTVLMAARAMGWTLCVDINLRTKVARDQGAYLQAVRRVMAEADWLKASDEDLQALGLPATDPAHTQALLVQVQAMAPRASRLALTFGAQGAALWVEGQLASQAGERVAVQDTVGAGDTFWGHTVADWLAHPDSAAARVAQTLHQASMAAAINCTRSGCQPPDAQEVLRALGQLTPQ